MRIPCADAGDAVICRDFLDLLQFAWEFTFAAIFRRLGAKTVAIAEQEPRAAAAAHNARLGVFLFLLYLILYVGFIGLNAFAREKMAAEVVAGVNLAVIYGLGLIVAAFVLAIVYVMFCRRPAVDDGKAADSK